MTALTGRPRDSQHLVRDLIDLEVVTSAEVMAGSVAFEEASMSHVAFRVTVDGRPRAFVKRCDPVGSSGRTLDAEVVVYELARHDPRLAAVMPRSLSVSPGGETLVLQCLPAVDEASSWPFAGPSLPGVGGRSVLEAYGRALAVVHDQRPAPFGDPPWLLWGLTATPPPVEGLPEPVAALYLEVANDPVMRRGIEVAAHDWQPAGLIHGDLRWTNVVADEPTGGAVGRVWLVDWELACVGDPAWDVGSVLADLVTGMAVGTARGATMDGLVLGATPFLRAYRRAAGHGSLTWTALLVRATRDAGLRLIQSISEYGFVDPVQGAAVRESLLPWSRHLLEHPAAVAAHLDHLAVA